MDKNQDRAAFKDGDELPPSWVDEAVSVWQATVELTPLSVRKAVGEVVAGQAGEIADLFYAQMLEHPRARAFLSSEAVNQRLRKMMQGWILQIFDYRSSSPAAVVARQIEVGSVHARIKLPVDVFGIGTRVMRHEIRARLASISATPEELLAAHLYVADLLHMADSLMIGAYAFNAQRSIRSDEAYRSVALKMDATLERERQRGALAEWAHQLLFALRRPGGKRAIQPLAESEFGMWLKHKGRVAFEGDPDLVAVFQSMEAIDGVLVPQLRICDDVEQTDHLIAELETQLEFVRFQLSDLFQRQLGSDRGRDAATQLFNRRYLPSVLNREMDAHRAAGESFGVILLRLDAMEKALYAQGIDSQGAVLQQLALIVNNLARAGDHVFRYGQETLMVLAVEQGMEGTLRSAELLRLRVREHAFILGGGAVIKLTLSIGVAVFDGHPDYQYLLGRAEAALDEARAAGGNRVVTAPTVRPESDGALPKGVS